jgi:virginiamycin B lyase
MPRYASLTALLILVGCAGSPLSSTTALLPFDRHSAMSADSPDVAQYIYWTNNKNGTVGRATIEGTGVQQKFIPSTTGGKGGGGGMTSNKQYIYWTSANGGTATTLLRAKLDGSNVNKNFITGAHNPCGVTVDSKYIYWGGDVGSAIGRANLDGTGVNQTFITTGTGVCGVVVTSSHIYWANYETGWIGRANLNGTGVNQDFIQTAAAGSLAIAGKYMYWTNDGTGIGRANIDGTGVQPDFITGLNGQVAFLAVDSSHIYWADWGNRGTGKTIGRANIDGTGVDQKFIAGTSGGFGIAVTGGSP